MAKRRLAVSFESVLYDDRGREAAAPLLDVEMPSSALDGLLFGMESFEITVFTRRQAAGRVEAIEGWIYAQALRHMNRSDHPEPRAAALRFVEQLAVTAARPRADIVFETDTFSSLSERVLHELALASARAPGDDRSVAALQAAFAGGAGAGTA